MHGAYEHDIVLDLIPGFLVLVRQTRNIAERYQARVYVVQPRYPLHVRDVVVPNLASTHEIYIGRREMKIPRLLEVVYDRIVRDSR
jgi:hypothetical protein